MKSLILTVIGVIFILLASVAVISYESDYNLKKFVIGGNKESKDYHKIKAIHYNMKTFTIGQKPTGKAHLIRLKKQSKCARERNLKYQQRDEEIEKCIGKITKNWKRTYGKMSHEKIYGKDNQFIEENHFWE